MINNQFEFITDCHYEHGVDYRGGDIDAGTRAQTPKSCKNKCEEVANCHFFTWIKRPQEFQQPNCFLKKKYGWTKQAQPLGDLIISGRKNCEGKKSI